MSWLTGVVAENEKSAIVEPLLYDTPISRVLPVCKLGEGVGVIVGVGVTVIDGVTPVGEGVGVIEGVTVGVGDGHVIVLQ